MKDSFDVIELPVENWSEYKELRLNALKTDPQAFLSSYQREKAFPDEKWKQRVAAADEGVKSWMFFARKNGRLVGMVGGYRSDENLKDHSAEIWGVYVIPEERGGGVAKALMAKMLEKLNENPDIHTIKLEVNVDQEAAKKLYEHFGFKTVDTSEIVLGDDNKHRVAVMELTVQNKL